MSGIPSREEAFFAEAITQPTADRGLFVAQKCGADAALLARIAELLVAHAAGPDYLFNQVQTAQALPSRAEISSDVSAKRGWLMSAACYLRPAAAAGKLTRYEREVLLAGIEKQLAEL
jgi:hypothetical protein